MEDKQNPSPDWLLNPPTPPGFEKEPEKGPGRTKRLPLTLIAAVCTLILGLGIWIGAGVGSSEPTEPPETTTSPETTAPPETTTSPETTAPPETTTPPETTVQPEPGLEANLLRSDALPYLSTNSHYFLEDAIESPVFGSGYQRKQIATVTFLDTLAGAPEDAWDVSETGDGRVMAWVTPANDLYDLYIAGDGGVNAANACADLFAGYSNVEKICFGEAFHTTGATDMSRMFLGCFYLTDLTLTSFDTSAVQDMSDMFFECQYLTVLTLGNSYNTSSVQNMSGMFFDCFSLPELNLSSFDTSAVKDMSDMFWCCESLTDLTLGDSFVTNNAITWCMFDFCPAGADYQHLLN